MFLTTISEAMNEQRRATIFFCAALEINAEKESPNASTGFLYIIIVSSRGSSGFWKKGINLRSVVVSSSPIV